MAWFDVPRFRQDRFAIGFWVDPPFDGRAEARYRQIADAGFNLVLAGFQKIDERRFRRLLRRHDLRAIVWPRGDADTEGIDDPNVWGMALRDEPSARDFPELARRAKALKAARPRQFAYVNLFPNYATPGQLGSLDYDTHVADFVRTVQPEVLSMDHYPLFRPDRPTDGRDRYCENLETLRVHALRAGIPFWNFFNTMPYGRHTDPTESQLRWQVFASLAHGAKGVLWFCYYTPGGDEEFPKGGAIIARDDVPTHHYAQAKRINSTVANLGRTLMRCTSTGVLRVRPEDVPGKVLSGAPIVDLRRASVDPPGDYLVGTFRHEDGRRAARLMNYRTTHTAWPTVVFDAPDALVREVDPVTGRENPVRDESPKMAGIQIPLLDGGARLFLLP